jgi:hypothetical protein
MQRPHGERDNSEIHGTIPILEPDKGCATLALNQRAEYITIARDPLRNTAVPSGG